MELHQSSKHAAATKVRENARIKELSTVKGELAASCGDCASMRWGRSEMVLQTQKGKLYLNKAMKAVSTSSASV